MASTRPLTTTEKDNCLLKAISVGLINPAADINNLPEGNTTYGQVLISYTNQIGNASIIPVILNGNVINPHVAVGKMVRFGMREGLWLLQQFTHNQANGDAYGLLRNGNLEMVYGSELYRGPATLAGGVVTLEKTSAHIIPFTDENKVVGLVSDIRHTLLGMLYSYTLVNRDIPEVPSEHVKLHFTSCTLHISALALRRRVAKVPEAPIPLGQPLAQWLVNSLEDGNYLPHPPIDTGADALQLAAAMKELGLK